MGKSYLERLISGHRDFLAEAKDRILVINEAIEDLINERVKLEGIVKLYEQPEVIPSPDKDPLPLSDPVLPKAVPPAETITGQSIKNVKRAYNSKQTSMGRGRSEGSTESQILTAFRGRQLLLAHHSQIAKEIGRETPEDNNKNVRRALTTLKERKEIIPITVQRVHPRGHLIDTPIYGLAEMFSDPNNAILLPEYENAKAETLRELGFSPKESNT